MIKLSDLLECVSPPDEQTDLMNLAVATAKRMEAADVPGDSPPRTPLVDEDGCKVYIIIDERCCCADMHSTGRDAGLDARNRTEDTGQPHTVCQVLAPVNGECPTIPVLTFTPTPERPHDWIIYRDMGEYNCHWLSITGRGDWYWGSSPHHVETRRFPTATEAQAYINKNNIQDAYPWPVPKLTS